MPAQSQAGEPSATGKEAKKKHCLLTQATERKGSGKSPSHAQQTSYSQLQRSAVKQQPDTRAQNVNSGEGIPAGLASLVQLDLSSLRKKIGTGQGGGRQDVYIPWYSRNTTPSSARASGQQQQQQQQPKDAYLGSCSRHIGLSAQQVNTGGVIRNVAALNEQPGVLPSPAITANRLNDLHTSGHRDAGRSVGLLASMPAEHRTDLVLSPRTCYDSYRTKPKAYSMPHYESQRYNPNDCATNHAQQLAVGMAVLHPISIPSTTAPPQQHSLPCPSPAQRPKTVPAALSSKEARRRWGPASRPQTAQCGYSERHVCDSKPVSPSHTFVNNTASQPIMTDVHSAKCSATTMTRQNSPMRVKVQVKTPYHACDGISAHETQHCNTTTAYTHYSEDAATTIIENLQGVSSMHDTLSPVSIMSQQHISHRTRRRVAESCPPSNSSSQGYRLSNSYLQCAAMAVAQAQVSTAHHLLTRLTASAAKRSSSPYNLQQNPGGRPARALSCSDTAQQQLGPEQPFQGQQEDCRMQSTETANVDACGPLSCMSVCGTGSSIKTEQRTQPHSSADTMPVVRHTQSVDGTAQPDGSQHSSTEFPGSQLIQEDWRAVALQWLGSSSGSSYLNTKVQAAASRLASPRDMPECLSTSRAGELWAKLRQMGPKGICIAYFQSMAVGQENDVSNVVAYINLQAVSGFRDSAVALSARSRVQAFERIAPGCKRTVSRLATSRPTSMCGNGSRISLAGLPGEPPGPCPERMHKSEGGFGGAIQEENDNVNGQLFGEGDANAKRKAEVSALIMANPTMFVEESAAQAEQSLLEAVSAARQNLQNVQNPGSKAKKSERHLIEAFKNSIRELQTERLVFHSPLVQQSKITRPVTPAAQSNEDKPSHPPWSLETSVFAPRKRESEARDYYETEKVLEAQFKLDWQRIAVKTRFRKLVSREDKEVQTKSQALETELSEIRHELAAHKAVLRSIFNYYSVASSGSGGVSSSNMFNLSLNQWLMFCNDARIIDNTGQRGTTIGDLQNVFVAVNFEEDHKTEESKANNDDAMMRFEFLEGLVRAAFGKFIASRKCFDASDAVCMLLKEVVLPVMPPEAIIDTNNFRRERLYNEDMDVSVRRHWDLIDAMHRIPRAKERSKHFTIEHWVSLLDSVNLIGAHTGVEYRELRLIFAWSQLTVTDELNNKKRALSLTFIDFIEALARLADLISPPEPAEVDAWFATRQQSSESGRVITTPRPQPSEPTIRLSEYWRGVGADGTRRKRPSAELLFPPTRPLAVKFVAMLDVMCHRLRAIWGGKDESDCANRMKKAAYSLSGGTV